MYHVGEAMNIDRLQETIDALELADLEDDYIHELRDIKNELETQTARADMWYDKYIELKGEYQLMLEDRDQLLAKLEDVERFVLIAASKCK